MPTMSQHSNVEYKGATYSASLNLRAGHISVLRCPSDPEGVNLVNIDNDYGFGNLCITRKDGPPQRDETLWSPIKLKSWQLKEGREFASILEQSGSTVRLGNAQSGHSITYHFNETFFDISLKGDLAYADQCGLVFPMAFMDLRQADDNAFQFNPTSLHRSDERDLCYVLLERRKGPGVLFTALAPCAGWRLVYGPEWPIRALQMLARFDSRFDHSGFNAGSIDFKVRVSFPESFDEAMQMVRSYTGLPMVDGPSYYAETGSQLPLRFRGRVSKALVIAPDGHSSELPLEKVSEEVSVSTLALTQEGFWRVKALGENGLGGDAVIRASLPFLETLKRARALNQPSLGGNAEDSYWVQAFCAFHKQLPPDSRIDGFLYNQLVDIWMQGLPFGGNPSPPAAEISKENLKPRLVKDWVIPSFEDGYYLHAPCPEGHQHGGRRFSPFHLFRWERIQDAFAMIQSFLYASRAFGNDLFYEQAVRIANAHIADHVDDSGRIQCMREDNLAVDYTTVITPLVSLIELFREMKRREDPRAESLRETCVKVAEHLMAREFEFPTEGAPAHMRWTEDGSISCTALSLFFAYAHLVQDERYLARAVEVMDYHRIWTLRVPDVRVHGASFRYWETMWENDGEGRAINAGHAWNIWQAEAFFYQGILTGNPMALLMSWNGFCANWAKFRADGKLAGCFTPDYIPQRPPRLELCHCYPEHNDPSLSYYVWPRMLETWSNTSALISPELIGFPEEFGPIALNGRLRREGESLYFQSHAISFQRLLLFGEVPDVVIEGSPQPVQATRYP